MSQKISYSELVSIILKEINRFRQHPQTIIPVLQKRKSHYQQKIYLYGGNNTIKITTQQGVIPVEQSISVVSTSERLPPFVWSYELHAAANKRARYLAKSDQNSQNAINLSSLDDLLPENFQFNGEVSEHFVYGYCDPLDILTNLLIDDGHNLRQNRQSLLNRQLNHIGIGIEHHPKYMFIVVLIMVSRTQQKPKITAQLRSSMEQNRHNAGVPNSDMHMLKKIQPNLAQDQVVFEKSTSDQNCRSCSLF